MKSLALFTRQLAAMLRGGLPLVVALEQLAAAFPVKRFSRAAREIAAGLNRGYSLHRLLADRRRLFPLFYVRMVEAGEEGDSLLPTLNALAEYYGEREKINRRLLRILFYPLLLLGVALASGLFALWHVVPTFAGLYAALGADIPPATGRVFAAAAYLTPGRLLLFLGSFGLLALAAGRVVRMLQWPLAARLPLAGTIACYWFCRICAMVTAAGHTLETALGMAAAVSPRGPAPVALARLRSGYGLYEALAGSPGVLRAFVAQGEATGQLPEALARAADYYRGRVEEALDDFQRCLEPVAVLAVGTAVGLMLIALMLPMLQLARAF